MHSKPVTAPCWDCGRPVTKIRRGGRSWLCIDCAVNRSDAWSRFQRDVSQLTTDQRRAVHRLILEQLAAQR